MASKPLANGGVVSPGQGKANAEHMRKHMAYRKEYRLLLAEGRNESLKLALKLLKMGNDEGGAIGRDTMTALSEVLKDAREVLTKPARVVKKQNGSGIPHEEVEEALKALEED